MSVTKASNGTYEVQLWVRDFDGKRRKLHKRGFKKKSDAQKWEREQKLRQEGSPSMTFADFVELYFADVTPHLKLNTILTKRHMVATKLVPYFGGMRLDEITPADVLRWQGSLKTTVNQSTGKPYSATYRRTIENQLSAILHHAQRFYGLKENPLLAAGRSAKGHAEEMKVWSRDEYRRFSDAIADKPLSFLAFQCLYYTGCREGELLALTPADFDLKRLTMRINKSYQRLRSEDVITSPKTEKSNRTIAIPSFLAEEVEEHVRLFGVEPDERLFPVSKSYLFNEMKRGCKASGVKRIRIHDLRHTHVSTLIDLGFNALAIAERMGHESIDITLRYGHLFPSAQADMVRALEGLRGGEEG